MKKIVVLLVCMLLAGCYGSAGYYQYSRYPVNYGPYPYYNTPYYYYYNRPWYHVPQREGWHERHEWNEHHGWRHW